MTVDEALAIVEIVLDYRRLNKVQELVFRQSWEGQSYGEIAKSTGYQYDYIKAAGYELWKLLSQALGEKVKRDNLQSVLKRYLWRTQVNIQRNLVIEVNLSGANLSGANLNGARVVANFIETDLSKASYHEVITPPDHTESNENLTDIPENDNQGIQSNLEQGIDWKGLHLHSQAQVRIAEALDRLGVLFIPNSQVRLTTPEGRQNQPANFLILYQGKLGILEVGGETLPQNSSPDEVRNISFVASGIHLVKYYDFKRCSEQPDLVVQEFLERLS
ncbi:MAG: pentapeptide repeat-containing protein [Actinomycetota bacterium]